MSSTPQQIDYFNAFIKNTLSENEQTVFLAKLQQDQAFKAAFDLHQELLAGIQRAHLRGEVQQAYRSYQHYKLWKYFALGIVLLGLMTSVYFMTTLSKAEPVITEQVVSVDTTTVAQVVEDTLKEEPIKAKKEVVTTAKKPKKAVTDPLTALYSSWKKAPVVFTIRADRDTILRAAEGTQFFIAANSFRSASGKLVKGNVTFKATEYYTKSSFIQAKLGTTSDGKLLESGGMLYLEAKQGRRKLSLAKDIFVAFTGDQQEKQMKTFVGNESDDGLNWKLASELSKGSRKSELDPIEKVKERPRDSLTELGYSRDTLSEYPVEVEGDTSISRVVNGTTVFATDDNYRATVFNINEAGPQEFVGNFLRVPQLSWINCDRFYNTRARKVKQRVQGEIFENQKFVLVFHDINSMMGVSWQSQGRAAFDRVPQGMKVTALALAFKEGNYFIGEATGQVSNNVLTMTYKEIPKEDIPPYLAKTYNNFAK